MSNNKFTFIFLIAALLTLFGCMISGDVFIKYIAYDSKSLQCSSIVPPTYIQIFNNIIYNTRADAIIAAESFTESAKTAKIGAAQQAATANTAASVAANANTEITTIDKYNSASTTEKTQILENSKTSAARADENAIIATKALTIAYEAKNSATNAADSVKYAMSGYTVATDTYQQTVNDSKDAAILSANAASVSAIAAALSANDAAKKVAEMQNVTAFTKVYYSPLTYQQPIVNTLNTCIAISKVEINFAQFRVIINWLAFVITTFILFFAIKDYRKSRLYSSIISITLSLFLWLMMLIGGIILSLFVFNASLNTCNNKEYYCYDLSNNSLIFAKMYSVLSFFITFIVNIGIIYYMASKL